MAILLLIVGLLLFIGLVVIHEFGHYIAARRGGVDVEEFGIGFPPRAWKRKLKSGMLFTINWLPLGGFVKLKGEHDDAEEPGSFGAASLKTKVTIMVAGVIMNLLTAFVLLTALAAVGMPKLIENQFTVKSDTKVVESRVIAGSVEEGSPADRAGLQVRDRLVKFETETGELPINSASDLPEITRSLAGQKTKLSVERDGKTEVLDLTLRGETEVADSRKTSKPKGYVGVTPAEFSLQRSTWSSPVVAAGLIKQFTQETFKGLGSAISSLARGQGGEASQQVAGPVGVFVILREGSNIGFQFMLMIIAIISLTLAIMNILPIPALDGGRLFVTLVYKALRRPLTQATEDKIHGTGFVALMLLFLVITVVDVRRFF